MKRKILNNVTWVKTNWEPILFPNQSSFRFTIYRIFSDACLVALPEVIFTGAYYAFVIIAERYSRRSRCGELLWKTSTKTYFLSQSDGVMACSASFFLRFLLSLRPKAAIFTFSQRNHFGFVFFAPQISFFSAFLKFSFLWLQKKYISVYVNRFRAP